LLSAPVNKLTAVSEHFFLYFLIISSRVVVCHLEKVGTKTTIPSTRVLAVAETNEEALVVNTTLLGAVQMLKLSLVCY
jgi:hypothetical protein